MRNYYRELKHETNAYRRLRAVLEFQDKNQYEICSEPNCIHYRNGRSNYCSTHKYNKFYFGHTRGRIIKRHELKEELQWIRKYLKVTDGYKSNEHYLNIVRIFVDPYDKFHRSVFSKVPESKLDEMITRMLSIWLLYYRQNVHRPIVLNIDMLNINIVHILLRYTKQMKVFSRKNRKIIAGYLNRKTGVHMLMLTRQIMNHLGIGS